MTKDMTTGSPLRIILLFSIPVLLGNLFQQFYNMVDTIIVGRYLGEEALAAVGSTGCLMFLVLGFANGIAQGFGVMVSHAFGAKDFKLLLAWMHTPENIIAMADAYIKVIFAGILLTMAYNVLSGILRGIGDSRTPLYFLILSSVLNIILDVVLIVYTGLGTAGAAYATIIAQGVSAVLCFFYMYRKYDILRTRHEDYYLDSAGVKNMLAIGVPMALNYSITAIGTMIMQSAVNVFGSSVVAAFTAASKVSNIATQSMPTLGTAMATYCGQNLGAGKYDRIYAGMRQGLFLCFGAAATAAAICIFGGRFIVSWFVSNPSEEIFSSAMQYLTIASWFFLPLAMIFLYRNALQGLDQGLIPMLSGVVELACRFGVIALIPASTGFFGVCFADPAAWAGAGIPLFITYLLWEHRMKQCSKAA
ncbi:MATE family efflux transporter [Roseburia hominis]|uniref:MATE family efflux transporter n=1 Tax=Roseburia hominis TaxID=301301 RepID=UPI00242CEC2A|nr:MATE family efflux transporter [Roseburia hominis]MBS5059518.1 MATE family efflux transporter [Roseburia hominis]